VARSYKHTTIIYFRINYDRKKFKSRVLGRLEKLVVVMIEVVKGFV
jgi:hypothetical protein